jgi:putative two-component system response regulator
LGRLAGRCDEMPLRRDLHLRGIRRAVPRNQDTGGRLPSALPQSFRSMEMRVLVVDDDEISRDILAQILDQYGYDVVTACNGREALETLAREDCRLVISDWVMPEVNGTTLCRAIRGGEFSSYIYVILVSARNRRQDVIAGLSAGADDFIPKPFDPEELLVRVRAGERILGLETRDLTIFAMAKLAEARDPETGNHLERMRRYSRLLAEHLATGDRYRDQIDGEFLRTIFLTSALHDIGKIAIKDEVLLKPGRLTEAEFEIMKTHTTRGAETLEAALRIHPEANFLRMARDIAHCHHERYDGSGYPEGLSGEQIPLAARIAALADVYDTLTSPRVYKEPSEHRAARAHIVANRGAQFDPDVVDAFLAVEEGWHEIRRRFPDGVPAESTELVECG